MAKRKKTQPNKPQTEVREISTSPGIPELTADALWLCCDPETLGFQTTDDLPDLQSVIGQPRAIRALELGSEVAGPGYNIFVLGVPGSGRTTLSQEYLQRKAALEPPPDDWCYVNNFDNPLSPRALRLPPGKGGELKKDLSEFVNYCKREIPRVFESKEYGTERDRIIEELNKNQEAEFTKLQDYASRHSFVIVRTPSGILVIPAAHGKPLTPEEVQQLSAEHRTKFERIQARLAEEVEKTLKTLRDLGIQTFEKLRELNRQTITFVTQPILADLKEKYQSVEPVRQYLETVQADIIQNAGEFRPHEGGEPEPAQHRWLQRYDVNVLVDNGGITAAPVINEMHPVYHNLLGRIEHEMVMGASRTDFTMIRAGALHKANGGYLILPARDLLISPYAWEGIKRALRDGYIRIVELGNQIGLLSTESLDPEPIPLALKVILVGTPLLCYLLQNYDEDFAKLFKVRAEFATLMDRNQEAEREYGLYVHSVCLDNQLPPFDKTAIARIIEFSSRLAESQLKLSTRFGRIADLVREAAYWARKQNGDNPAHVVTVTAVQKAIDEAIYRANLLDQHLQEMITDGILMIDVQDAVVGQVNALSVYSLGDFSFGKPSRVAVSVAPGRAGIIDIERVAHLGGPIHTKGVMILAGFLNSRYSCNGPLSLSASLAFEQSYSEIDGDSASAAELFALLSAIADVPIRQDLAVTGSVNQHGQIQAIGGVNEKIEGFFATCQAKGLTGRQGVLIPKANQRHLMLNAKVIQAVSGGQFHIWTIATVEEGLALLTGLEPGTADPTGQYPPGTLNERILKRLEAYTNLIKHPASEPEATPGEEGKDIEQPAAPPR